MKKIYGVGVNDAKYALSRFEEIECTKRRVWIFPEYKVWSNMLFRCYSEKAKLKCPSYLLCEVAPEWHIFSNFKKWIDTQDWKGKEIDKDILFPGVKIYSPETCVFVSQQLNCFLTDRKALRGELPIGVSRASGSGKFRARCRNPFTLKSESLGNFLSPEAAHEAWRARKHQHACRYADMQTDPRIAAALRTHYLPGKEAI